MIPSSPFTAQLACLHALMPVHRLLHVGGRPILEGIAADMTCIVEADGQLADKLAGEDSWTVHTALLAAGEGQTVYYTASNRNESSIIPPSALTSFWKNLAILEQQQLGTTTIDLLVAGAVLPHDINWMVVDCLPALPILLGAAQCLTGCDVVVVRAVIDTQRLPEQGATRHELEDLLAGYGFSCIATEEELQPAIAKLLYVRNYRQLLAADRDQQVKRADQHQQQIEQLTKACDEQLTLANDQQNQLVQLAKLKDEQGRLADDLRLQLETAAKEKAELSAARNEQARLATERQAELGKLTRALQEAENKTVQLEAKLAEYDYRQHQMNEELVKAEGQIELIKDLLLREPGL